MNTKNGQKDAHQMPLPWQINGKKVDKRIYPETARPHGLRVFVYRECPNQPKHGWLRKVLEEAWQDSGTVIIRSRVVCHIDQQHVEEFPPQRLALSVLIPLLALRPPPEKEPCKMVKSIRF